MTNQTYSAVYSDDSRALNKVVVLIKDDIGDSYVRDGIKYVFTEQTVSQIGVTKHYHPEVL